MNLELVFTLDGTAVLEEDGDQVWASDDDEVFQQEIGDVLDIEDATAVLQYLMDEEYITRQEAQLLSISVEEDEEEDESAKIDISNDDIIEGEFKEIPATQHRRGKH